MDDRGLSDDEMDAPTGIPGYLQELPLLVDIVRVCGGGSIFSHSPDLVTTDACHYTKSFKLV